MNSFKFAAFNDDELLELKAALTLHTESYQRCGVVLMLPYNLLDEIQDELGLRFNELQEG